MEECSCFIVQIYRRSRRRPSRSAREMKRMFFFSVNKVILSGHFRRHFGASRALLFILYGHARGRFWADSINFNVGRWAPPNRYSYRADNACPKYAIYFSVNVEIHVFRKSVFVRDIVGFFIFAYHRDSRSSFFLTTEYPFKRYDSDNVRSSLYESVSYTPFS